jgi:HSP20 family protein
MLNSTRWTPWAEIALFRRDLDSILGRMFGQGEAHPSVESFTPAADVRRVGDKWMLSMAIPGVSPDKVDMDVVGRTLRVRGERTANGESALGPVVSEISYGRFERAFTLPEDVDAQHVEATYRHGMLEVVLPVIEGAKAHRVEIKAAPEAKQLHAM